MLVTDMFIIFKKVTLEVHAQMQKVLLYKMLVDKCCFCTDQMIMIVYKKPLDECVHVCH